MLPLILLVLAIQLVAPIRCRHSPWPFAGPSTFPLLSPPESQQEAPLTDHKYIYESVPKRTYFANDVHLTRTGQSSANNPSNHAASKRELAELRRRYDTSSFDFEHEVDAFNHEICGEAQTYEWQIDQHSFHCRGIAQPRIDQSPNNFIGRQFAAHVFLEIERLPGRAASRCAGTLIHKNLVLTSALCVKEAIQITVRLGVDNFDDSGPLVVVADSFCLMPAQEPGLDAAIVRLTNDVEYKRKMIQPACIMPNKRLNETALVGYRGGNRPFDDKMLNVISDVDCRPNGKFSACIRPKLGQLGCWLYPGTGFFNTDTCSSSGGYQQLYLVGMTTRQADRTQCDRPNGYDVKLQVLDLQKAQASLDLMIMMMVVTKGELEQYCVKLNY